MACISMRRSTRREWLVVALVIALTFLAGLGARFASADDYLPGDPDGGCDPYQQN